MNLIQRLFGSTSAPEEKRFRGMTVQSNPGKASWRTKSSYQSYAKEAYQQNVIAFSAINRVARAISYIDWVVYQDDKRLTSHPLLELINRPNPMQTRSQWWEQKIGYLLLDGNSFEHRQILNGTVREVWNLRPDRMSVIGGSSGIPQAYEYKVNQQVKRFPVSSITGESDIRHLKLFNPLDDWRGLSPISAASYDVDQNTESKIWMQSLLQNMARPSGALVIDSEQGLSEDEFSRLKAEVEQQYSGSENAGRPMLLEGGMDWKAMGLSPIDMEILRIREMSARDISLAFGVPPLLLNIPGDNTYANYREARLGFYEDTVLPLLTYLVEDFNFWNSPYFGGAQLAPDYDSIEAIAEKRQKQWEMADNSDDLTLNESRALKGFDPLPDPLGSTLMAEIRKGAQRDPQGGEPDPFEEEKRRAYGPAR